MMLAYHNLKTLQYPWSPQGHQAFSKMATLSEQTLFRQEQLAGTRKRKRELTQAIKEKTKQLQRMAEASSVGGGGGQSVATLLEQIGASSFESSQPSLPPQLATHTSTLLMLLELSGFCTDVVVSWAMGQGRPQKQSMAVDQLWDTDIRSKIAAGVEWLYILAPLDHVVSLPDAAPQQILRLSRYAAEHKLFHWVIKQNCDSGVSPQNSQLVAEAIRSVPAGLPTNLKEQFCNFFLSSDRATRYWVQSFCGRWGVDTGRRLRPGENMDPKVMESKESWLQCIVLSKILSSQIAASKGC